MHLWAFAYFEEVGHSTKCCHLVTSIFFWSNFFRTLIRACTRSFANVCEGATLENIKLGQIFGASKNGSWVLVDAHNFFFDLSIRAQTGSFGNVFGGVTLENINWVKFLVHQKMGHGS